jgi:hypothetical protein
MVEFIIGAVVGVSCGWLIPQPQWFKDLVAKAKAKTQ